MRLVITEKQLRGIIKSGEVKEQEASTPEAPTMPDSAPSGGSSSDGGGDAGGLGGRKASGRRPHAG